MAYGDDTKFQAWLDLQGFTLPADAPSLAQLRARGSMHVDAHVFPGAPSEPFVQDNAWPRTGATAFGAEVPADLVPVQVEQAAYAAGYFDAMNPGALTTRSSADQRVKRERVEGVVDTEYFDNGADGAASASVTVPMVEGLLAPFLANPAGEPTFFIV